MIEKEREKLFCMCIIIIIEKTEKNIDVQQEFNAN